MIKCYLVGKTWFSHIAVEVPGENTKTEWCESINNEEYNKLESDNENDS